MKTKICEMPYLPRICLVFVALVNTSVFGNVFKSANMRALLNTHKYSSKYTVFGHVHKYIQIHSNTLDHISQ